MQQQQPVLYKYKETGISFHSRSKSSLMVNATEIAKAFPGKRPGECWRHLIN